MLLELTPWGRDMINFSSNSVVNFCEQFEAEVLVAHTGFEPVTSALRGRRPKPLDECAFLQLRVLAQKSFQRAGTLLNIIILCK